jgi:glycosyltransferase involved in cell wall biosynthesis
MAYYPDFVGGAEAAVREITDRIDTDKIEFHMITLRYDSRLAKQEKIGNIWITRIGFTKDSPELADLKKFPLHLNKLFYQFEAAWVALKMHRVNNYDAIWAIMAHSAGVPATIFKMLRPKVPFILTLQEGDPLDKIEKTMKPLWFFFSRAFKKADIVHAISSYLGKWAKRRGFSREPKIIFNGGNPGDFAAKFSENELEALRDKLGMKKENIYLMTASRLVVKNGVDIGIRALALLPENIKFLVVGGGPEEDNLQELVRKLNLENRVIFTGQIERTEVPKYRKIADIFLRPSRSEGLGNALISAMAAHLPVIATQEGGIAEFLFDRKRNPDKETTGWAVDKENPEQIAEAVKQIIANPVEVKKVTDTAYRIANEKYNWDKIVEDMQTQVFAEAFNIK